MTDCWLVYTWGTKGPCIAKWYGLKFSAENGQPYPCLFKVKLKEGEENIPLDDLRELYPYAN